MMGLIARFLPSLVPGLTAFLNPWVLLTLLGALLGSFFYGMHIESVKFAAFRAQVAVIGEAQNAKAAQKAKDDKALKKETDNVYKVENDKLARDNAALGKRVREGAGSSYVSAGQQPAGSKCPDGQACFDAREFDAALRESARGTQSFAEATVGLVGEGASVALKLDTGIAWVAEQRKRK